MIFVAYTIHVVVCLFLILVVLLQQGKGADLSVFGGGGTQAAFGARGATTLLHKLTVWAFVGFILTTIAIGFLQTAGSQSTVFSSAPAEEGAAPPAEEPGAALPAAGGDAEPAAGGEAEAVPEGAPAEPATQPAAGAGGAAATDGPPAGDAAPATGGTTGPPAG